MGNRMNFADRVQADADLFWRLQREVQLLAAEHPDGFAVRLHILGDFFSVEYVQLWARLWNNIRRCACSDTPRGTMWAIRLPSR